MPARVLTLLAVCALLGAAVAVPPAGAKTHKANVRLRQFRTCPNLISYGIKHAPKPAAPQRQPQPGVMTPTVQGGGNDTGSSAPAPAAAPAPTEQSPSFSTTNNQEAGVDE